MFATMGIDVESFIVSLIILPREVLGIPSKKFVRLVPKNNKILRCWRSREDRCLQLGVLMSRVSLLA